MSDDETIEHTQDTDTPLESFAAYRSPTLGRLPSNLRPQTSTVCETCPASVWYSYKEGVKAYCTIMHLNTWSHEDPKALMDCDGRDMALAAREARLAKE